MRIIYSFLAALFLAFPAFAADKAPDVNSAIQQWKTAIEAGKVDDIMKLYDKDAIMISTFAEDPLTKRSDIEAYYKVIVNEDKKVVIGDTHPRVFGNVAVNSGRYTISYTEEGEKLELPARFSFVYVLKDGKWLIVDQHSSRVPSKQNQK